MNKKIFCFINEKDAKIKLAFYLINDNKEEIVASNITDEVICQFPFNSQTSLTTISNYSQIILEKLVNFIDTKKIKIDLVVMLERSFQTSLVLPRLHGKALKESYQNELKKQFGDYINDYILNVKKVLNENKGYTFDITFVNKVDLQKIIMLFNLAKIKINQIVYLPSLFSNTFAAEKGINAGIFMDDDLSYLYLVYQKKVINYRTLPYGIKRINDEIRQKFKLSLEEVDKFKQENLTKSALKIVVYHVIREVIEQLYLLLFTTCQNDLTFKSMTLNKTYLDITGGNIKEIIMGFPLLMIKKLSLVKHESKYQYESLIKAYYQKNKNFLYLDKKVNYGK